jgi:uncharacterized protein YodC (DUF2158 family)
VEDLKVGDVAVLKSGGPKMTVFLIETQTYGCVWFDSESRVYRRRFGKSLLKKTS